MTKGSLWPRVELDEAALVRALSGWGAVATQYVTASLESTAWPARPDLIFVPRSGPFAGLHHLIELKGAVGEAVPDHVLASAIAHARAVSKTNGPSVRYAFVTSSRPTMSQAALARSKGVHVISAESESQVASKVFDWVNPEPNATLLTNYSGDHVITNSSRDTRLHIEQSDLDRLMCPDPFSATRVPAIVVEAPSAALLPTYEGLEACGEVFTSPRLLSSEGHAALTSVRLGQTVIVEVGEHQSDRSTDAAQVSVGR